MDIESMEPRLSLVIPTYNEELRLPQTLVSLRALAERIALQVVVSDDGSTDETCEVVRDLTKQSAWGFSVELVENSHRGKGAAVRQGMRQVVAPIVGYLDADLSPSTDAVQQLFEEINTGTDMAIASRGLPGSIIEVRPAWHRERAGRIFNFLLRRLTGIPFRDTQCGLKLWRLEVAQEIFRRQRVDGFAFDAELVVLAYRLGYQVKEIPVRWSHAEGSKLSIARESVRMSRDLLRIVLSDAHHRNQS
jgi:dolichyl-phosphate beta-glucosyltransferase